MEVVGLTAKTPSRQDAEYKKAVQLKLEDWLLSLDILGVSAIVRLGGFVISSVTEEK